MTTEDIARMIKAAMDGRQYQGKSLTKYTAQSIEQSRSNYPASNLLAYLTDSGLKLVIRDSLTLDTFSTKTVLGVHQTINLLMERYQIEPMMVYRKTGMYYTPPKSLSEEKLIKMAGRGGKYKLPLSINVMLAVFDTLKCDISIEIDESSAVNRTKGHAKEKRKPNNEQE